MISFEFPILVSGFLPYFVRFDPSYLRISCFFVAQNYKLKVTICNFYIFLLYCYPLSEHSEPTTCNEGHCCFGKAEGHQAGHAQGTSFYYLFLATL